MSFTDNRNNFSSVLLYGNELSMIIFEILLMALVDVIQSNFFIDTFVTVFVMEVS